MDLKPSYSKLAWAFVLAAVLPACGAEGLEEGEGPASDEPIGVDTEAAVGDTLPLYRLFAQTESAQRQKDQLLTSVSSEYFSVVNTSWWKGVGATGLVWKETASDRKPLYRVYKKSTTDHFYTWDKGERDQAISNGYVGEGIVGYVYTSSRANTCRVYRMYGSGNTVHVYTTSVAERNSLRDRYPAHNWESNGDFWIGKVGDCNLSAFDYD